jgi:hypothetical protein
MKIRPTVALCAPAVRHGWSDEQTWCAGARFHPTKSSYGRDSESITHALLERETMARHALSTLVTFTRAR